MSTIAPTNNAPASARVEDLARDAGDPVCAAVEKGGESCHG